MDWNVVSQDILKSQTWQELKEKYLMQVVKNVNQNSQLLFNQKYKFLFSKMKGIQRRLKIPFYKIRDKGFLVAFVGVDGAGKSSSVEYVQNLDFFKNTGIKRVYFGNNEYWIPGLQRLLKKEVKNKFLKLLLGTLSLVDRQLRVLIALYYIQLGNIVLADRYIYDDEIGRVQNKEKNNKKPLIKRIYQKIFGVKMWKKPELTIFFDVSPEVAYSRKQDYSFEKMLEVNKAYKDYIANQSDQAMLKAHVASVEAHINGISIKEYENLEGVLTLDFIFVFIPIESALLVALDQKPDLFTTALKKNIVLVSPSTLMMSLKTVHHIWQTERQNQNSEEIARQAGAMYDKLFGFVTSMDDIEKHLDKAQKSYKEARGKLSDGKGNLIGRAEKLKTLGVQSKKELK